LSAEQPPNTPPSLSSLEEDDVAELSSAPIVSLEQVLQDAEDFLFPQLTFSARERALYYHLLRKAWIGESRPVHAEITVSVDGLATALGWSPDVRYVLRDLTKKGVLTASRSRKGHFVKVLLPREVAGVQFVEAASDVEDLSTADVYAGRRFAELILKREGSSCFYCLRSISLTDVELDHAVPLAAGGDSTFRNVVASCHDCNSLKRDVAPGDFIRMLYRRGLLNAREMENGLGRLNDLFAGQRPLS